MKHYRWTLLVLLLVSLALACPAAAETDSSRLVEWLNGRYDISLDEDAGAWVQQALGSDENGQVRLTVDEAVYDGVKAWVLLTLEPLEEGQSSPDLEAQALVVDTDNEPTASWTCQTVEADGALTLLAEISLNGQSPEQLSLHVGTDSEQPLAVSFHLDRTPSARAAYTLEGSGGEADILWADRVDTPFAAYLLYGYSLRNAALDGAASLLQEDGRYYATPNGMYAHLNARCSGMKDATELSGLDAIEQGKIPCPECIGTYQPPRQGQMTWIDEGATYYATPNGLYIHLDRECSGMQGASEIAGEEAIAQDRVPCPICVAGRTEQVGGMSFLSMAPRDAQGQPLEGALWYEEGAPASEDVFDLVSVYMFPKDAFPEGSLFLAPDNAEDASAFMKLIPGP